MSDSREQTSMCDLTAGAFLPKRLHVVRVHRAREKKQNHLIRIKLIKRGCASPAAMHCLVLLFFHELFSL